MIIKTDRVTAVAAASAINSPSSTDSPNNSIKNGKKKRSIIPKIFSSKRDERGGSDEDIFKSDDGGIDLVILYYYYFVFHCYRLEKSFATKRKTFLETHVLRRVSQQTSPEIEGLNLSTFEESMAPATELQDIRLFVATWNVGGKTPNNGLNLEDFLQAEDSADIYVLGFQEIVPLSAGNVLVIEDNEPAYESIYSSSDIGPGSKVSNNNITRDSSKCTSSLNFFQRPSLRAIRRSLRADSTLLKSSGSHQIGRHSSVEEYLSIAEIPFSPTSPSTPSSPSPTSHSQMSYSLVASKQMVGIFLSVWARKELVPYIGHLRVSSVGRGIMGCFGNKGCISMSMSLHQTSFCFVCSHLASGEKEGDELKRNADICKNPNSRAPERINDHDRVIWLGDLNYRVALTYEETRVLLENNDWDTLLEKDQLNLEREAGRVFPGFDEGRIYFAPTYKYTHNSDSYAGKRCDRILWRGNGIEQLYYIRGESRFSDHRPVCAVFTVEVEIENKNNNRFRMGYTCAGQRFDFEDCIPQRHSLYEL
ncbi:hypothetical protein RGQ29_021927 [Quercus rubra]|uniref:Inositol polyphosphate-related phosphatase domain-containing protein n=1 Tax=Quercus rubra TaxID=3512 RepID=A0AAN7IRR6_QUERU|nr:hypothetical protein RGQ29_021927 [Quercus rubra]